MRKVAGFLLAMGLAVGLVAGCGSPSKQNVVSKLQTQAEALDASNYQSTATMTVQMDNGSQTYYVETSYESPEVYKIALGDANKHINQIIVKNQNGMFIVSPSLQKVFRFNGNWAQNQGHIYLYDQILQQIVKSADEAKISSANSQYTITLPVSPENDVVTTQKVSISNNLEPKQVVLLDKKDKAVVTIDFKSFTKGVKFNDTDFDPQKLATSGQPTKTTMASTASTVELGYIEPTQTFNDKMDILQPENNETILHYAGPHGFTLDEARPAAGVTGLPEAQLVDLYGVPGVLSQSSDGVSQLTWFNGGMEFSLTSSQLSPSQMQEVAISTFGQSGK